MIAHQQLELSMIVEMTKAELPCCESDGLLRAAIIVAMMATIADLADDFNFYVNYPLTRPLFPDI